MKKLTLMCFIAFSSNGFLFAQKNDSLLCKMIADSVPVGWSAKLEKGTIIVAKKDSVWFYNGINAPLELKPSEKPPFAATKGVYQMEIKIQNAWTQKVMRSAVKNNSALMNKVYEKYKMAEINNKNGDFAPKNEDEQRRVEAYYKECETLQSQLVTIPTINGEKNSYIVHSSISGGSSVWPSKSSGEIYNTEAKIYSILRK